jgi:subtilase family serine protease
MSGSTTPPTDAQCESVGRTCFTPQAIQSAYHVGPLYAGGWNGRGKTIAIVDAWGSDTIAHDLHVFNNAFGLPHMCGEEGVTCAAGMPTFTVFHPNGSPATQPQPGNGTGLEDKTLWDLETTLDVETAHAIAPGANILLVATTGAETLGVQGFPNMMKAEKTVVDNGLAQVISQSFASAEEAFGSTSSLLNLRDAFQAAAANGVTVFGASGDNGTANATKQSLLKQGGNIIPFPTVEWPASDPLVTGVGGTYLCTNPTLGTNDPRTPYFAPGVGGKCGSNAFNPGHNLAEVAWTFSGGGFSHVFSKPSYQNTLPAGSTPIGAARGVPDIAFQASAGTGALIYITLPPDGLSGLICGSSPCSTGWYDIGGTSLATPQWAGLAAIGAQMKGHGLGPINNALYTIASNPAKYAADFYDVATNNTNQADPSVPGYPATTGWDPVTGLGTPNAANLIPDLVALTP